MLIKFWIYMARYSPIDIHTEYILRNNSSLSQVVHLQCQSNVNDHNGPLLGHLRSTTNTQKLELQMVFLVSLNIILTDKQNNDRRHMYK